MKIADEQEHRLWVASKEYMHGRITMEELEEVESHHARIRRKAVMKHARRSVTRHAVDAVVAAIVRVVREGPSTNSLLG